MRVMVRGDGIAARCCTRLLERGGFGVTLQRSPRPKLPAIMIGAGTQALFGDAFGQPGLFCGMQPITQRVVAWGVAAEPRVLPHSAIVAREQELLDRLPTSADGPASDTPANWTVVASRPLPEVREEHHFGARIARAIPVRLKRDAPCSTCWVESLESGWLFLIPGWLLAAGEAQERPLETGRLVNRQIADVAGEPADFPAYPRIAWPLCGPGWLACGTGALAFDPLCGDGSGYAIREAILAAAVLRAIDRGGEAEDLLAHYRTRLLGGFQRHLEACAEFYRTGGSSPWWQAQLEAVREGLLWCKETLRNAPPARYQLRDFDLYRMS
jgi:hypothetical protein